MIRPCLIRRTGNRHARALLLPCLLAGLSLTGCGSAAPPKYLPGLKPLPANASPTAVVRHAYQSLAHSSYHLDASLRLMVDTSDVQSAQASQLDARLDNLNSTVTARATITDLAHFQMTEHILGRTLYLKAANGIYEASEDGVIYQQLPSSQGNALFSTLQGDDVKDANHFQDVRAVGQAKDNGISVERYTASIPGSAVASDAPALDSILGKNSPTGLTYHSYTVTIDVDRRTGFPVESSGASQVMLNLAALHKPGVSGTVSLSFIDTRTYSDFRAHKAASA